MCLEATAVDGFPVCAAAAAVVVVFVVVVVVVVVVFVESFPLLVFFFSLWERLRVINFRSSPCAR